MFYPVRTRRPTPRSSHAPRGKATRPLLEALEDRTAPAVFTVTNSLDDGSTGSLRWAITQANADTDPLSTIDFNIPGTGTQTIALTAELPHVTHPVEIDGSTQGGAGHPFIELDGANAGGDYVAAGVGSGPVGLTLAGGNSTVKDLIINRFTGTGIVLTASGGDTVQGCYIGTDATGTQALGNAGDGILIVDAPDNQIGGPNAGDGNVISGNTNTEAGYGYFPGEAIRIVGNSPGNLIQNNFIGTDRTGENPLPNAYGIGMTTANNTVVGNVIAACTGNPNGPFSGPGVFLDGGAATGNALKGNRIGTDALGGTPLPNNGPGLLVYNGPSNNTIGGTSAADRNVISGNTNSGIILWETDGNTVAGNYIGTDAGGNRRLGNGQDGISVIGPDANNTISDNLVSANQSSGIALYAQDAFYTVTGILLTGSHPITGTLIQGNRIGTNAAGTQALGNFTNGIEVLGQVSGTVIHGNLISGNDYSYQFYGFTAGPFYGDVEFEADSGNVLTGNKIGTDITGTVSLGGYGDGVTLQDSTGDTVGGASATDANVISGHRGSSTSLHSGSGITINDFAATATDNVVEGNLIGTDLTGTQNLGNAGSGVYLSASNNTIGGASSGAGNVIAFNQQGGAVDVVSGAGNAILGNSIHDDGLGIHLSENTNDNQAAPVLSAVYTSIVGTLLTGTFSGTPCATFRLEFFANTPGDPEGRTFLGSATAATDASGNGVFRVSLHSPVPAGQGLITATATNPNNSTSMFSAGVQAVFLTPSSLSGFVFVDFNDDGQIDFGEKGISGVTVTLTGTDTFGNPVNQSEFTDAAGSYLFPNLLPGNYDITETQPAGYLQGIDTVGTAGGSLIATDQFAVTLPQGTDGLNYNFGEQPPPSGQVHEGQTAGIGFWNNKNGQALIKALNGGPSSTQLASWLAATLPHVFGVSAGSNNLTGKTNADVAALFQADFLLKGVKLDAEVLATALNVYATNATLDPTRAAAAYGFTVSGDGVGTATVNVGGEGDAFGVANNTTLTILDLLKATDAQAVNGVLYGGNATLRKHANDVFSALNDAGGI